MQSMQYDNGFGGIAPGRFGAIRDEEKRQLRRQSNRTGLCLIASYVIQLGAGILIGTSPLVYQAYLQNTVVENVLNMLIYVCCLFLPFYICWRKMPPAERDVCDQFGKPTSAAAVAAAVAACFFFCTVGDYVTDGFLEILRRFGFVSTGGTYDSPTNVPELICAVLQIGVMPALVEEFALRSVVLQPMRRFSDRYAILMSAFVFALMHGNLTQIPFAFIAGIAFGYYTVATGSVWVGVLAHFVNNVYSVVISYLIETHPSAADTVYRVVLSATLVGGFLAIVLFWKVLPHHRLQKVQTALSGGEKTAVYLFTIPMVIAMIILLVQTAQLTDYVG